MYGTVTRPLPCIKAFVFPVFLESFPGESPSSTPRHALQSLLIIVLMQTGWLSLLTGKKELWWYYFSGLSKRGKKCEREELETSPNKSRVSCTVAAWAYGLLWDSRPCQLRKQIFPLCLGWEWVCSSLTLSPRHLAGMMNSLSPCVKPEVIGCFASVIICFFPRGKKGAGI